MALFLPFRARLRTEECEDQRPSTSISWTQQKGHIRVQSCDNNFYAASSDRDRWTTHINPSPILLSVLIVSCYPHRKQNRKHLLDTLIDLSQHRQTGQTPPTHSVSRLSPRSINFIYHNGSNTLIPFLSSILANKFSSPTESLPNLSFTAPWSSTSTLADTQSRKSQLAPSRSEANAAF